MTCSEARDILAEMRDGIPEEYEADREALDLAMLALAKMEYVTPKKSH